jgi:hypothetical protein
MRSAHSFWTALRKRHLITLKRPSRSLMNSASTTPLLRTHQPHQQQERHVRQRHKLQSAKGKTLPARSAISKPPHPTMGECIGRRRTRRHSASRNLWKRVSRRLGSFVLRRRLKAPTDALSTATEGNQPPERRGAHKLQATAGSQRHFSLAKVLLSAQSQSRCRL